MKLEMETENEAFQNGEIHYEIARILKEIAQKLEKLQDDGVIHDINGNKVGKWAISDQYFLSL